MSKFLTILVILILSLSSCSNNSDEPDPTPPRPQPTEDVSLDGLLGTWETFYYKKFLTVNPGIINKEQSYGALRIIDYDGFKTQFWKENGVYKFRSLNVFNEIIGKEYKEEGVFSLTAKKDSIQFTWFHNGKDTVTYQKIREFGAYPGVMTNEKDYLGRTEDGTQFRITDMKMSRKVEEAPNATGNINPVKEKLDFEDLSNGSWEIFKCLVFYDGTLNNHDSKVMGDTLIGTTYKFFTNDKGQKRCYIKERDPDNFEKWITNEFAVTLVDDLILFQYKDHNGENHAIWMWVYSREGKDSFIDKTQNRLASNVRVVYVQDSYLRRVPD